MKILKKLKMYKNYENSWGVQNCIKAAKIELENHSNPRKPSYVMN